MLNETQFHAVVRRAVLAPSAHNTQPARWALRGDVLLIGADPAAYLEVGDPTLRDAGLSCGAAVEATVLALSAVGIRADVEDLWEEDDQSSLPGHRLVARLRLTAGAEPDGLHAQLEQRFTWRGMFDAGAEIHGWDREDAVMVTDPARRGWLAALNDTVSLPIMNQRPFRRELVSWMRMLRWNPRYAHDGMSREAMGMSLPEALAAPLALGPLWPVLGRWGLTNGLVAEAEATVSAPIIACFHRPATESPVASGRAYLRMGLEAASLGLAGWPMAALSDDAESNAEICTRLGIGAERRLVQVIRFGKATGAAPPRARRPLGELIL